MPTRFAVRPAVATLPIVFNVVPAGHGAGKADGATVPPGDGETAADGQGEGDAAVATIEGDAVENAATEFE